MYIAEVWRYPVKSMAGEQVQTARVTPSGLEGDRTIQVRNAQGSTITSRTHPGLLGFHATLDEQGNPLIDSRPWTDLAIDGVVAGIEDLRGRCVMTTFDPDTFVQDPNILSDIVNGGQIEINQEVRFSERNWA